VAAADIAVQNVRAMGRDGFATMDETDRRLVALLVDDARMSYRELGERVSLSANATADRVRRLREVGVIAAFRAIVDPAASGRTLVVLMDVRLEAPAVADRFEDLVRSLDEVTDATHVTGRFDYQLRLACRDTAHVDRIIRLLKTKAGVIETDTRLALRTVVRRATADGTS
jgi:Lrp/AsnC family leucine-responsive transcriptional regulator